jgi:hypothetical protein
MNINLQHHNLLGNQISSKSEDFCIWWPFCTLVTMATTAILNLFNPPQMLPHTTVDIPKRFHEVWRKESKKKFIPPFFVSMATAAKFVQPIPIFFGLSRSTRSGCCFFQVSSISVWWVTCYDHFCVFQFFSILAISMAVAAILKIPKVVCTSTQ